MPINKFCFGLLLSLTFLINMSYGADLILAPYSQATDAALATLFAQDYMHLHYVEEIRQGKVYDQWKSENIEQNAKNIIKSFENDDAFIIWSDAKKTILGLIQIHRDYQKASIVRFMIKENNSNVIGKLVECAIEYKKQHSLPLIEFFESRLPSVLYTEIIVSMYEHGFQGDLQPNVIHKEGPFDFNPKLGTPEYNRRFFYQG